MRPIGAFTPAAAPPSSVSSEPPDPLVVSVLVSLPVDVPIGVSPAAPAAPVTIELSLLLVLVSVLLLLALSEVLAADSLQTTSVGRSLTPAEPQIWAAYLTAASLPASSQFFSRQQAIESRKLPFLQMQLISKDEQPAILSPVVASVTQGLCLSPKGQSGSIACVGKEYIRAYGAGGDGALCSD